MPDRAPVLTTARLTLRGHAPADLDDELALWSDPEVIRHIGGRPFGREEVWARLLRYIGHWAALGYGFWHVRDRATDRFVGEVGLADFQRGLAILPAGAAEAGWVLAPWAHGQGLATEAMTAVLAWGAAHGHAHTACIINPANAASCRVAARLGFRALGRTPYQDHEVLAFERHSR
jgi:RimJ/RimL family protein N-acetyltransferase